MNLPAIIKKLPSFERKIKTLDELILANLVMVNEIPAPTFSEQYRSEFLITRFAEDNLLNCSYDEKNNAVGILPGKNPEKNILITAHLDTIFDEKIEHNVSIHPNMVKGAGVGDNALGVAVLATLPKILEALDIELDSNLILLGSSRSLGRGNIEGIRFFLDNTELNIDSAVVVEGVKLGRLSFSSIGMVRCEISSEMPEEYDWTRFGAVGSIVTINEIINRILEIPLPKRPRTSIVLGSIHGGNSFNTIPTSANLRFEIRSESGSMVRDLRDQIESITAEIASHTGAECLFNVFAEREPGGILFNHPLSRSAREIMDSLGIKPRISPSTSELCAFIDKTIPALTIGITNGENMNQEDETIEIEPIFKGLSQLVGILLTLDNGGTDDGNE
ncbi:MAG: M20/M25/M40 family metallo-hydrolase [Spirochaetales bacterium]|nr:M20/M25/M40 family metallo-hydrolase [Spirochaetales bacterium]